MKNTKYTNNHDEVKQLYNGHNNHQNNDGIWSTQYLITIYPILLMSVATF